MVQGSALSNSRRGASTSFAFGPAEVSSSSWLLCVSPRSSRRRAWRSSALSGPKIKTSHEYQQAVEQSKKRTKEQTEQKAELQKLRIQINRLRRQREDTKDLFHRLEDKENSYGRRKQQRPPGAYLATNEIFSKE